MAFVYLSRLSRVLFEPYFLALFLLAASLVLRRFRRVNFFFILSAFLLLLVPGSPIISDPLVASLENQYPDSSIFAIPPAEAIVVLGGSVQLASGQHPASHILSSSDRLLVALRLYHAGKAPLILCSGGNGKIPIFAKSDGPPEARVMGDILQEWGLPPSALLTEEESSNTHENATKSYDLLSARHIRRIILVTSAIHMPRAAAAFRKAGFEVVPAPADFQAGWGEDDTSWFPNAGALVGTEFALREWFGLWIYRQRGWA
jgi:uncharacterized SAM-binding protein YcdF (DUF218 family)